MAAPAAPASISINPSPSQCPSTSSYSISRVLKTSCLLQRTSSSHFLLRGSRRPLFPTPPPLSSARFPASPLASARKLVISAASFDDSASVETEVKDTKVEEIREELEKQAEDSTASSGKDVPNLKDEAIKAEDGWKDTGESAEKLMGVIRDTTEQLMEQADKARAVLAATAQETAERSKENLSYIAENAPDPIKDIAETALKAHSPDTPKSVAKIHDFCLGIPYGSFLVIGGLLWFIISGSTAAIRFGVILGGILLGLSVSSLKVWKKGKSSMPYIKGQAAITFIILLREIRRYFEVKALPTAFVALASAAMLGFYSYVYMSGGNPPKKVKQAPGA